VPGPAGPKGDTGPAGASYTDAQVRAVVAGQLVAGTGMTITTDGEDLVLASTGGATAGDGGGTGLPDGGTAGQLLAKLSSIDGDADWVDPSTGGLVLYARKTADTSVANNNTPANDPDLQFLLVPPGTYSIEGALLTHSTVSTQDIFIGMNAANSTGGVVRFHSINTASAFNATSVYGNVIGAAMNTTSIGVGESTSMANVVDVIGTITFTTLGTLRLHWSQALSGSTPSTIRAGSWLRLTEISGSQTNQGPAGPQGAPGQGVLVLAPGDPVPVGTPEGTIILRTA
jgi:hypothetical protein